MDQAPRRGRYRVAAAEVRLEGQPASIRGRANAEHWSADLLWRRFSSHLAAFAIRLGMSADAVTALVIAAGLGAAASLLLGSVWGALLAVGLAHLQMLLDAADGEVARWRKTASARGVFLDHLAHTVTEAAMPACLGVGLALANPDHAGRWAAAGLALAALVLINKSVNDAVAVARAAAGLPRLPDVPASREPRSGALRSLRSAARWIPVHRLFHSVEQAHLYLVAFVVAIWAPSVLAWMMAALLVIAPLVIVGHVASALTSPRLAP
jgi:phosphatidylglycerophosphate synthase